MGPGQILRKKRSAFSGMTVLELLITLSLIGILAAFSIPSFRSIMQNQDETILQNTIVRLIQFAQDESIVRSTPVGLTVADKESIIVFTDDYHDGRVHNTKQILTRHPLEHLQGEIKIRSFPYYRSYLLFSGIRNDNASIYYCEKNQSLSKWVIVLSQTGRQRVSTDSLLPCHA